MEDKGIKTGPELTRQLLEKTLPWTVEVRILTAGDKEVMTWVPRGVVIRNWEDVARFTFGPKDVFFEL